jgi:hypothetical protein
VSLETLFHATHQRQAVLRNRIPIDLSEPAVTKHVLHVVGGKHLRW